MRFGVQIPQEGSEFEAVLAHARRAEELGYDSIWIPDHLTAIAVAPGSPCPEAWTILTGVLLGTTRIRGGPLVLCEAFRNPAWLANAAATLDRMSGGRLALGLGAGWHEREFRAYGFDWRSGAERVDRLDEALTAMKRMWEGKPFDGRWYAHEGTRDCPASVQRPHPPLWIGGSGPKMLGVVAAHADVWNAPVLTPEAVAARAARLRAICDATGRPMPVVTYEGPVWIDDDGERVRERVARNLASNNPVAVTYARTAIAGTPDEVAARIRAYADAGVTELICHFGRTEDLRGTELFAREVMPRFTSAGDRPLHRGPGHE